MKRLIRNVEQLNQVLHAIANGVTVQDTSGKLIFVNQAAARMMNCVSPEEALEKGGLAIVRGFKFYDENGRAIGLSELPGRQALQGVEEPEMIVGYAPDDKSEMRWTSLKAMPVFDDQGKVMLAVNVMQDITRLKAAERQLKEANDRVTRLLEKTLL
jgi:two-component system, sporulation sensor kinase A